MTEAAEKLDRLEVPAGGIGEFVKTDEEIEALERQEASREFGKDGIAYFNDVAGKMAGYGRFGDDSIAHIETGEIVVPKALIENNPQLKEQIFAELREAGIEDPEQYVVGSKANSINPETGLMEFGFLKKIFKKIGKFLKKAATIVLPIVLAGFGMPVGLAGMFGSGIGTLIQGGNLKDAFKAAAISGLAGGLLKGAGTALKGTGTFGEGFRGAFDTGGKGLFGKQGFIEKAFNLDAPTGGTTTPGTETGKILDDLKKGVGSEVKTDAVAFDGSGKPITGLIDETSALTQDGKLITTAGPQGGPPVVTQGGPTAPIDPNLVKMTGPAPEAFEYLKDFKEAGAKPTSFADYAKQLESMGPQGAEQLALLKNQTPSESIADILRSDRKMFGGGSKFREIMFPGKDASFIRRVGPGAAAAMGIMAATGGFKTPEQEDPGLFPVDEFGNPITGESLIRQNPGQYLIADLGDLYLDPETGTYKRKGSSNETLISEMLQARTPEQGPMMAAHGGDVEYPRRYGGIMPNEGIPDEDSVPALLMPGEFVFTTDAVKGLGDGSLNQGISRMYDVMSRLEKRGRQVA